MMTQLIGSPLAYARIIHIHEETRMDNQKLNDLLAVIPTQRCWIKPSGDPAHPPPPGTLYNKAIEEIQFAKRPHAIQFDDVLFVYAVGQSKLLFIADRFTPIRKAEPQEIDHEPWRARWPWSFRGHNYTPVYGSQWWNFHIRPFDLLKEYNSLHPADIQKLGAIQRGHDKHLISQGFALFIVHTLLTL